MAEIAPQIEPLPIGHREEALAFLAQRPLHTVIMAGLLREYGPSIPAPRGTFYTCRDGRGRLDGIALLGQATMFEARSQTSLAGFAALAKNISSVRMIMGEQKTLDEFLSHYSFGSRSPRLFCQELFYKFTQKNACHVGVPQLRKATLNDLEQVVSAHAEMVEEESGVNPMARDAEGFRQRCALRVAQGRVWALIEDGTLIFKADVITETPDTAYLEGVWVSPQRRGEGYGIRCWAELSRALLKKLPSFCGFVNTTNATAHHFYKRVGGVLFAQYGKVYL
jgi:GNAT superfamily N-acetyltransferase